MPAVPATTPNLGLPRFAPDDHTQLWVHLNAITDALDRLEGPWQTYQPEWLQSDGPHLNIGSGSLTGRFRQVGKTVEGRILLDWRADTNKGRAPWIFSLPKPYPRNWREVGGTVACVRNGKHYAGAIFPVGLGKIGVVIGDLGRLSNTIPENEWKDGDWYSINFSYEVG